MYILGGGVALANWKCCREKTGGSQGPLSWLERAERPTLTTVIKCHAALLAILKEVLLGLKEAR